jgi:hypothetical protein
LCLAGIGLLVRGRRRATVAAGTVAREGALVFALYSLWQIAGTLSVMQVTGAVDRGRWLWQVERSIGLLPNELSIQRAALPHPLVVQAFNGYYAIVHGPALVIFLIWLFARHRQSYPRWRNTIALVTGLSLAIQLVPVAPPRLVHSLGFVDTALRYGQSVYGRIGSGMADQLSAMPSVHVAWAALIAVAVLRTSRSPWRSLVLAHPALTLLAVVATGNHFWLDGVAAMAILALVLLAQRYGSAAVAAYRVRSRSGAAGSLSAPGLGADCAYGDWVASTSRR